MFQQWVGSNSPTVPVPRGSDEGPASDPSMPGDPPSDSGAPTGYAPVGTEAAALDRSSVELSFDLTSPPVFPVEPNVTLSSPPTTGVTPGYQERPSPESTLSFHSIHSGHVSRSNSPQMPRTVSLTRTISIASNQDANVINGLNTGTTDGSNTGTANGADSNGNQPASSSNQAPAREISYENVNLAQVQEGLEKYFGYLARCEEKFCTTTLFF